jgi:hypothetical protein
MNGAIGVDDGAAGIGSGNEHGIRQISWNICLTGIVEPPRNNASVGPDCYRMSESRRNSQELSSRRVVDYAEFLQ